MLLSLITATYNRATSLQSVAIPSVLSQSDLAFEWIIINDGEDEVTHQVVNALIGSSLAKPRVAYHPIPHPQSGFGLCHARNLGLTLARGKWVSYLDDDNALAPTFTREVKAFIAEHPDVKFSMVQQQRRREVVNASSQVIQQGQPFLSPTTGSGIDALISQKALFDSNGFTHRKENAPRWNPAYRVFADYEYLLQCAGVWGKEGFKLNAQVLVEYVQRSDGVIGRSSYREWAEELKAIAFTDTARVAQSDDSVLTEADKAVLWQQIKLWQSKAERHQSVPAFTLPLTDSNDRFLIT